MPVIQPSITLTVESGSGSPEKFDLTGVVMNYAPNAIPQCLVDLTPAHLSVLCNIENYRRKNCVIEIRTVRGCLRFLGLIDGLSEHIAYGHVGLALVVKSRFQVLLETYPRIPGVHPSSVGLLQRKNILRNADDDATFFDRWSALTQAVAASEAPSVRHIVKYIVELIKLALIQQKDVQQFTTLGGYDGTALVELLGKMTPTTIDLGLDMLGRIDASALDGMLGSSDNQNWYQLVDQLVLQNNSFNNLYELLVGALSAFGCSLVIGNEKAFIIPSTGYIKMSHSTPPLQARSTIPNVFYPADYTSLAFNDSGYRDISACFVMADSDITYEIRPGMASLGQYIDPNAKGGVFITTLPQPMAFLMASLQGKITESKRKELSGGAPAFVGPPTLEQVTQEVEAARMKTIEDSSEQLRKMMNNWAQMKYLEAKHDDRVGTVTGMFNPRVCPGAPITVYTRQPGSYIDGYVTSVTHTIRMQPNDSGQAETTVGFAGGRMAKTGVETGLDKIELLAYDAAKAEAVIAAYVEDVTK